jgi:pimeloyl-ACP methyl ester carboxylesterase
MSAILLDGGIVHYEVIGRGRPILFLHGWVGSWRYWVPAMQTASTGFRAYALDFWGFGETARNQTQYGMDKQVALLDHFLQELGMSKVAIVGHGLGALVGLLFTMRYPTVVDRIMAVGLPFDVNSINNKLRSAPLQELADWLLLKNAEAEPARIDGLKADPTALATSFNSPDLLNLSQRIGSLNTPCLLVYGQNDPAISTPNYEKSSAPLSMHTVMLEQSAHFPMLDDPAGFNRLLTDFLALQSGESPRDLQMKEEWKRRVR